MDFLIGAVLGGFFSAVFTLIITILYNRSKRPTPNYKFEFEKEIPYQGVVQGAFGMVIPTTGHLSNYIRIENYGADSLFNVSVKIWFNTRKERHYYQTMELPENLFDLQVKELSEYFYFPNQDILLMTKSRAEILEEKTKQGVFIPDETMEKLKRLSPINLNVDYSYDGKNYSDIWLLDFSDENDPLFSMRSLTFWEKTKLFFKRILL